MAKELSSSNLEGVNGGTYESCGYQVYYLSELANLKVNDVVAVYYNKTSIDLEYLGSGTVTNVTNERYATVTVVCNGNTYQSSSKHRYTLGPKHTS